MNFFDQTIIDFINQFSQFSWTLDTTIKFISGNHLVKGGALVIILWWGWFKAGEKQQNIQIHLLTTVFSCLVAIAFARALALLLPFRFRPIHSDNFDFTLPHTMELTKLEGWSSFPSDHAVLFYALSAGMFYISKKAGVFALAYTTIFIALPRIYLGLHYPSDILGGAIIGIAITFLCNSNKFIRIASQSVRNWSDTKPEFFYPMFFIFSYQIADMFLNTRSLIEFISSTIQTIVA